MKQLEGVAEDWTYYVRSTVLGGAVVMELNKQNGVWQKDIFVYALGQMIAQQKKSYWAADEVRWNYQNPVTGAQRGAVISEPDPLGRDTIPPPAQPPIIPDSGIMDPGRYTDGLNGRFGCTINGAPASCDLAYGLIGSGVGVQCPDNDCGMRYRPRDIDGDGTVDSFWDQFRAYADGVSGYGPAFGAAYAGNGRFNLPGSRKPPVLRPGPSNRERNPNTQRGPNVDPEADDGIVSFINTSWHLTTDMNPRTESNDDCNHWLGFYYSYLKNRFDEVWERHIKSFSKERLRGVEKGAVISIHDSRVSPGGKEETAIDHYIAKYEDQDGMESAFNDWVIETRRVRILAGWTTITVHTHPIPESRGIPSTGDYNNVPVNGADALITNAEITVYNSEKVICRIQR